MPFIDSLTDAAVDQPFVQTSAGTQDYADIMSVGNNGQREGALGQ
jgi:hypothetical protein